MTTVIQEDAWALLRKRITELEFELGNARGTLNIMRQSLDEARARPTSEEAEALHEQLDRDGIVPGTLRDRVRALMRETDRESRRVAGQRLADLSGESTFLAQRVAWHLGNGCDSPEKARELALREWRVGVLGEPA